MIAKWLADTVASFGRILHLGNFELNDRGVAAVKFENGSRLVLECAADTMFVSVTSAVDALSEETAKALLREADPRRQKPYPVRAVALRGGREIRLVTALPLDQVDVRTLEAAFEALWKRMERVRRAEWA